LPVYNDFAVAVVRFLTDKPFGASRTSQ
jgi:hypothetical protein